MLRRGYTSELSKRHVCLSQWQLPIILSSQHALCWEALGDISHITVQFPKAEQICDHSRLKTRTQC